MDKKSGRPRLSLTVEQKRERNNTWKRLHRLANKEKAIAHMGGRCAHCDGVFHSSAFDFHHTDPSKKDVDPGALLAYTEDKLYAELAKCILLCANCHRIHHFNEANANNPEEFDMRRKRTLKYKDAEETIASWGRITGLGYEVIRTRIDEYGWSVEEALTIPKRGRRG